LHAIAYFWHPACMIFPSMEKELAQKRRNTNLGLFLF
jgi:hypothetical protein